MAFHRSSEGEDYILYYIIRLRTDPMNPDPNEFRKLRQVKPCKINALSGIFEN